MYNARPFQSIFQYLLLFVLFAPPILEYLPWTSIVYSVLNVLKIAALLYLAYDFFKGKITILYALLILFSLWMGVTTFVHEGQYRYFAQLLVCVLGASFWAKRYLMTEDGFKRSCRFFCFLLLINAISMIVFPDGVIRFGKESQYSLVSIWVLGYSNIMVPYCILGIFLAAFSFVKWRSKLAAVLFVSSVFPMMLGTSMTGRFVCVVELILLSGYFVIWKNGSRPRFRMTVVMIAIFILFLLIVVFDATSLFSRIFVDFLHKDLSLTGRTEVWKTAMFYIQRNPMLGIGIQPTGYMYGILGVSHCHDYYLNILLESGWPGLIIWLFALIAISVRVDRAESKISAVLVSIALTAFLITFLDETYNYRYLSSFYALCVVGFEMNTCSLFELDGVAKRESGR